jgi:TPR repeat protein
VIGGFVARLRIEREIGRGRDAIVYLARDASGEGFALKVFQGLDAKALQRFEREGDLQSGLTGTPGILPLLATGRREGRAALVFPYVAGGSLREALSAGRRWSSEEALGLGLRLCEALTPVHEGGIVHRDLKPGNVLLADDGSPLVADLGLARYREVSQELTEVGHALGTAGYAPPEQLNDSTAVTAAADVFALGALLSECVTGTPVFPGSTLEALNAMARRDVLPSLSNLAPGVDPVLSAAVDAALEFDPRLRPQNAAALGAALRGEWSPRSRRGRVLVVALGLVCMALAAAGLRSGLRSLGGPEEAQVSLEAPSPAPSAIAARESEGERLVRLRSAAEGGAAADLHAYALALRAAASEASMGEAFVHRQEARGYLKRAAELGHGPAALTLGEDLLLGVGLNERRPKLGVYWLRRAADLGEVHALTQLANCHRFGLGASKNLDRAIELLKEAAEAGDKAAFMNLYAIHLARRDVSRAERWARAAIDAGETVAEFELVKLLLQGDDPDRWREALTLLRRGASRSEPHAELYLGRVLLQGGPGVERDPKAALPVLERAAERDTDGVADVLLADVFVMNLGVPRDLPRAERHLIRALKVCENDLRAGIQARLQAVRRALHGK